MKKLNTSIQYNLLSCLDRWIETPSGKGKLVDYYKNKQGILVVEVAFMSGLDSIVVDAFEGEEVNSFYFNSKPLLLFWMDKWNKN